MPTLRLPCGCVRREGSRRRQTLTTDWTSAGRRCSTVSCARVQRVSVDGQRVGRYARAGWRWARLLAPRRRRDGVRVFYGHDVIPKEGEPVAGGTAKFQRLAR